MIGGGAKRMIERGLTAERRTSATEEIERLYRAFIEHYAEHIADRSRTFPDLEGALERLSALGFGLAVCTNKLEWLSVRLLDALRIRERFAAICGQDTFGILKPNPEMLRRTVEQAGGTLAQAVMVGDSATDVTLARAAGVPVIAVDFGYSDVPVATLQADRVISSFAELAPTVFALFPTARSLASPATL
jgi:phosphoglycolate phosphatase